MKNYFAEFQEKLSSLSAVHKVLLFAATLLVMGAAFYFLKFEGQLDTLKQLKSQITETAKQTCLSKGGGFQDQGA